MASSVRGRGRRRGACRCRGCARRGDPPARSDRGRRACRAAVVAPCAAGSRADRCGRRRDATRYGAGRRSGGGDVARQGVPDARALERSPRPTRVGAHGRPRARRNAARAAADAGAAGEDPCPSAPALGAWGDIARRAPAPARGLHRDDRVRDRAHLRPRRARLAAAGDRVRPLPHRASGGRSGAPCSTGCPSRRRSRRTCAARSSARSSSRSRVSTRSCRCSTRRSSWRPRAARTRCSSGSPIAGASTSSRTPSGAVHVDPARVRRGAARSTRSSPIPREARATSSTTSPPRSRA